MADPNFASASLPTSTTLLRPQKSTTCNKKGTKYQFTATTWKGFRRTAPLDFKRWYNFAQNLRIDKNHFFSLNQINVLVSVLPNPKQAAPLFLPLRKEVLFSCQDLVLMEASRPRKKDCLAPNGVYLLLAKRGWEVFQQEARWRSCQRAKLLSFFKNSGARSKPTFILQNKTLHLASAARVVCILCWANISVNKFPNLNIYWNLQIVTHSSISSMNIACFALARVRPKERSLFLFCSFYINFI